MTTTAAPAPRFAGQEMTLGGTTFVVPPIALGALKTLLPKIQSLQLSDQGVPGIAQVEDALEICLAALKRNYPDLTLEQLGDLVDLGNFNALVRAVMGQSGLVRTPEGNSGPGTASP